MGYKPLSSKQMRAIARAMVSKNPSESEQFIQEKAFMLLCRTVEGLPYETDDDDMLRLYLIEHIDMICSENDTIL